MKAIKSNFKMADERAPTNDKIVGDLYVKLVTGYCYKIQFAEKDQVCVIETYICLLFSLSQI